MALSLCSTLPPFSLSLSLCLYTTPHPATAPLTKTTDPCKYQLCLLCTCVSPCVCLLHMHEMLQLWMLQVTDTKGTFSYAFMFHELLIFSPLHWTKRHHSDYSIIAVFLQKAFILPHFLSCLQRLDFTCLTSSLKNILKSPGIRL